MSRSFYTAVTHQVLIFGAELWVLTKKMESALDAFQGRVARQLTGRKPFRGRDGEWFYPSLVGALKEAGVARARIGPPKTEYGRAIYCNVNDSGGSARWRRGVGGHGSHIGGGNSRELIGGWRGRRRQRQRRRWEQTRQRRRRRDRDRNRNQTQIPRQEGPRAAPGRRRPWESVVPVGWSGAGRGLSPSDSN